MKIAVWGMGVHGNKLLTLLLTVLRDTYEVSCLIDQNDRIFEKYCIPQNIICITPNDIKEYYDRHAFDAVVIGSGRRDYRQQMISALMEKQIPVMDEQKLVFKAPCWEKPNNYMEKAQIIEKHLADQESRELFNSRLYMMATRNETPFLETIWRYQNGRQYYIWDLMDPMKKCGAKRVILFGDGRDVSLNLSSLRLCEADIAAICVLQDSMRNLPFLTFEKIIVVDELMNSEFDDCLVIISSKKNREQIHNVLSSIDFPEERIYDPPNSYRPILTGSRYMQYFDVWAPRTHEVFVDCGAYDGQNLLEFQQWAVKYDAIYALEPLPIMQEKILNKIKTLHNTKLFAVAAWDKNEEVEFEVQGDLPSSQINLRENHRSPNHIFVHGVTLDSIIKERVSFLKMDIEGSELAAINGAEKLIKKWKPRLAICIYHKPEDVLEIPLRILEIVPEYRFCIRHYSSGVYETVLYATVEENVWLDTESKIIIN